MDLLNRLRQRRIVADWPKLGRYQAENAALPAPRAGEKRVVFLGDSITEFWTSYGPGASEENPCFFAGKPYINRGISGQTTPQILLRFRQDVLDLKPALVVLLAGTNDINGRTGPMTPEQTEGNLMTMAELARANGVRLVMCSILPVYSFRRVPWMRPAATVIQINRWIRGYAEAHGHPYVDYHTAMADERGGLPERLGPDGVHPNRAGYAVMNPLVEAGITEALG